MDFINKIYNINCSVGLKNLPDNIIDCCVTSPPYYGLRDYGTAQWEGGDINCSHKREGKHGKSCITGQDQVIGEIGDAIYKSVCPKCGAVRIDEQIGLEETPEEYISRLVEVFTEVYRILKPEGTLWINIGDSYWGGKGYSGSSAGKYQYERRKDGKSITRECSNFGGKGTIRPTGRKHEYIKTKDLIGIPWMLAFALRNAGWYLRQDIIWNKPNPMPESVLDRCTKSHEYIFLLTKSAHYYFDHNAILEPASYDGRRDTFYKGGPKDMNCTEHERWPNKIDGGECPARNKRSVWAVCTKPEREAHFACFPEKLIVDCIKAGCPEGGVVLDPFMGSGTTAVVARKLDRNYVGFELNPEYVRISNRKLNRELGIFK
jgi:DNA modification methylase